MKFDRKMDRGPRTLGVACAGGAVLLGLVYMTLAGAPVRYLAINIAALVVGLAIWVAIVRLGPKRRDWIGSMALAMAMVLLGTALLGDQVDGAARWVKLGPLVIQPSLMFLPAMLVAFARSRDALCTAGMVIAAAALAAQPDRAMSAMLAACVGILVMRRPDRLSLLACAAGVLSFAVALARPDTLPAVPYVDHILYSSFDVHALAGAAVLAGLGLLVIPGIVGALRDSTNPDAYVAFVIAWLAAILAAALGNYPTPVVGYGGSAIIGYVLSLAMLPRATVASCHAPAEAPDEADAAVERQRMNIGLFRSPHRYWLLTLVIAALLHYGWGQATRTRGDQIVSFRAAQKACSSSGPLRYCVYRDAAGTNGDIVYHLPGRNLDEHIWNSDTYFTAMLQEQWQRHRAVPPTVVTLSYGGTWLLTPRGRQPDSGLLEDLMARLPAIEERLGAPRRRILLGESMGGLNVLVAGLSYPSRFAKVAALCPGVYTISPFASLSTIRASMVRTGASPKIAFGIWLMARKYVAGDDEWRRISPLHLIQSAGPGYPALYLSNGLYDAYGNYEGTELLANTARQRGVRTEWNPVYGGHCATDLRSLARFLVE